MFAGHNVTCTTTNNVNINIEQQLQQHQHERRQRSTTSTSTTSIQQQTSATNRRTRATASLARVLGTAPSTRRKACLILPSRSARPTAASSSRASTTPACGKLGERLTKRPYCLWNDRRNEGMTYGGIYLPTDRCCHTGQTTKPTTTKRPTDLPTECPTDL